MGKKVDRSADLKLESAPVVKVTEITFFPHSHVGREH